ncbi:LL-diaminopimelate aminotransferase [Lachnospiraceae bacterium CLA-AA-H215]|uniref:LL-diaminopimelate aminotransferase n=1 Tax=Hominifimenecus microfluidus TaxID=2885348 RepID=A0AAE3EAU4_9FIRM|nr:LL-diaminopimelate aminotransferase [Hominifimenecus microfluidus]MCC2231434.1 LL-diaminopimelate aminotransferase [Hominifimenecus microfluidus]
MKINEHYLELEDSYLFSTVARKQREYQQAHPEKKVIRLSIGDVTLPLAPVVIKAMEDAVKEMGSKATFRGYGPEQGYDFLREAVQAYYQGHGVSLDVDEIFISDGAKSDLGNLLDIFSLDNTVMIPNPVYPVYQDTNIMLGRQVIYAEAGEENGFLPLPDPAVKADIVYLCSPNNPTGAVYSREQLAAWVDYAKKNDAVILYDAAYECFIRDDETPHSIFEIEGAKECAIEVCSFSKTAGFTGTRCGYTVVPMALVSGGTPLNHLWLRRQTTKFNGVPYIVQRGAAAVFTEEGQMQVREAVDYYRENAKIMVDGMKKMGIWFTGGVNSPYIWMKCPGGRTSWEFFDYLLENAGVVGTPGSGFGRNGEGYFRLTAFGDQAETREAMERMIALLS